MTRVLLTQEPTESLAALRHGHLPATDKPCEGPKLCRFVGGGDDHRFPQLTGEAQLIAPTPKGNGGHEGVAKTARARGNDRLG